MSKGGPLSLSGSKKLPLSYARRLTFGSQGKKKRQHGNDAVKSHIIAARTVANIVKTSLVRSEKTIPTKADRDRDQGGSTKSSYHQMETSQSQTMARLFSRRWRSRITLPNYW